MDIFNYINCPVEDAHIEEYKNGVPFKHIVIDDFLKHEILDVLETPVPNEHWYKYENSLEKKFATDKANVIPPNLYKMLMIFNSSPFITWLEELTGIQGLIPDPHLRGGGIHCIKRGGLLKPHQDFNIHERLGLYRRLNMILYLNSGWKKEWGGQLELWDSSMQILVQSILPTYNRCVIFDTAGKNYHGHSNPLQCPPDKMRISLALYYYTSKPGPEQETAPHSTKFQLRPGDPKTPEILELIERRNRSRLASNV